MIKILIALLCVCFSISVQAFPCFLTLVKDNCWTNYNVSVGATNATTGKLITTVTVLQGKSWTRQAFDCEPAEAISFVASFSPVFWENDVGKTYAALRDWRLPEAIATGDTAWNITLCYPGQFSEVPLPPDASGTCACKTDDIPPIPPQ